MIEWEAGGGECPLKGIFRDTRPPKDNLAKGRFWVTCLELDLKICILSQAPGWCWGCCSLDHISRARLCALLFNTVATSQIKYNSKFTFSVIPATFQYPPYCTQQNRTLSSSQKALWDSNDRPMTTSWRNPFSPLLHTHPQCVCRWDPGIFVPTMCYWLDSADLTVTPSWFSVLAAHSKSPNFEDVEQSKTQHII